MARTARQEPASLTRAVRLLLALVGVSGLTALLTVVFHEELVRVWGVGHADTGSVRPPAFVPVAIVLFCVFAALTGVLTVFIRAGHNWARLSLSALLVFMVLGTLAGLRIDPPVLFVVLSALSIVLELVLLFFLWHRDTGAYIRGARLTSDTEANGPTAAS